MTDSLRQALEREGLGDLYAVFAAQDLDSADLNGLTEADLRELGLTMGQRKRFLRAYAQVEAPPPAAPERAAPRAERRQITTMFCDLVGSTQLATSLDPEDLRDVIESFLTLCGDAIRAHAGHIAFAQGDGVMAYFGFPSAREDDPERAVRCAFEILQRLEGLQTKAPGPLAARIGIATGLVVVGESHDRAFGEGIVVGETPNLGARLQSLAGPGEVIVGETTRRLCGGLFEYEPRGATEVKGFPAPVPVYRVLREGAAPNRFEARASVGLSPIVGRDAELERLQRAWRSTLGGTGRLVLISGEAGIGKSRLAHAFLEAVADDQPRVLRWYCAAHLTNRPLHPVVRAIESMEGLGRQLPAETRREAIGRLVAGSPLLEAQDEPFLADLLGLETEVREAHDAPTRARRTHDALLRRLKGHATAAPLLILMEDAHWADAATLDFLSLLIEQLTRFPALVVITHRPEFVPPWRAGPGCEAIALQALDSEAGHRLVDQILRGQTLPPSWRRTILDKAGGVPLFVEELTRTILEGVGERDLADGGPDLAEVPATLHDLLMARLDRLGPDKAIAQVGSVIGREFTPAMLRAVLPDHPELEAGIARLCATGLALSGERAGARVISFRHALIQDSAYGSLLRRQRRDIHRAVARAMLDGDPAFAGSEPEVIARHCTGGALPAEAVAHWLEAGLQAMDRAAAAPALTYLGSALAQLQEAPEHPERLTTELRIHMALAPATMAIHGWAAREVEKISRRAIELAAGSGDAQALCGGTWLLWTNFFIRGEMDPALETARSVAAMAEQSGSAFLALAAAHALSYTHYSRGEFAHCLAAARAGLARLDPENDRQALRIFQLAPGEALPAIMANAHWMLGELEEAEAAMGRAHAAAEALQHPPALVHCLCVSSYWLLFSGQWDRLHPIAERAVRISVEEGYRFWEPMARIALACAAAGQGALGPALESALANMERYKATGAGLVASQFEPHLAGLMIRSGDPAGALRRLDACIPDAEARAERCYMPELYRVRSAAHAALGDRAAAWRDLQLASALAAEQGALPLLDRARADLTSFARRADSDSRSRADVT